MTTIGLGALALTAFLSTHAIGAVTSTVIDVPTSKGPQRTLEVRGDSVHAYLVSIAGGSGFYDIRDDGTMPSAAGACSPPARNMWDFAARGIAVALVNSAGYRTDEIMAFLRTRNAVPLWITGGSSSTGTVASWAVNLPLSVPLGLLEYSPEHLPPAVAASILWPTLVLYHVNDGTAFGPELFNNLASAPAKELVALVGGTSTDCGHHLFAGLEAEYVAATAGFIDKYNGLLGGTSPTSATKVPVVEYFNAGFGHYFMTAQSDEITGLDGGAFGGAFVRTGLGFNAWDAPTTDTVPVCRFFTTPGNFGTRSSHFYTADAAECEFVKQNPDWQYEKIAFHTQVPAGGVCPAGTLAVYRAFNNGQTGAPNHRFTTDLAIYQQFIGQLGWGAEGIKFCAPA